MMNGSMAALPAALGGTLGMTLQGAHQNINHQLSQLRNGFSSKKFRRAHDFCRQFHIETIFALKIDQFAMKKDEISMPKLRQICTL